MKILKCKKGNGEVRIVCVNNSSSIFNFNKLSELKFKAVNLGKTNIKVQSGKVSGIYNSIKKLQQSECGNQYVLIE